MYDAIKTPKNPFNISKKSVNAAAFLFPLRRMLVAPIFFEPNVRGSWILKKNFPKTFSLKGIKIAIDCANGAAYKSAPKLLESLGAKVFNTGTNPNGKNINLKCGSTYPNKIKLLTKKVKANVGISLDGDADRIIMCDENSNIIDGDKILAMLAERWKRKKILKGGVIGTLMSNYGLENFFKNKNIKFYRSNVGDRYVKELMQEKKFNLGGEQSGHIILSDYSKTGDGILAALKVTEIISKLKKSTSTIFDLYENSPQIKINIPYKKISKNTVNYIKNINKKKLKDKNMRLLIRLSGTEPLIRILVEGNDLNKVNTIAKNIEKNIRKKLGK